MPRSKSPPPAAGPTDPLAAAAKPVDAAVAAARALIAVAGPPPPGWVDIRVRLAGDGPLVLRRQGAPARVDDPLDCCHRRPAGGLVLPAAEFLTAIEERLRVEHKLRRAMDIAPVPAPKDLRAAIALLHAAVLCRDPNALLGGIPKLRRDAGQPDAAQLDEWDATLRLRVDAARLPLDVLTSWLVAAGTFAGVGVYRPGKRTPKGVRNTGACGTFHVDICRPEP